MTQTEWEFFKEYQESAAGVQKFMRTYADYMSNTGELKLLRILFTTDCLMENIYPDTYEADCILYDVWGRIKDIILENPDCMDKNRSKSFEEEYCHNLEECLENAFENYMYKYLI